MKNVLIFFGVTLLAASSQGAHHFNRPETGPTATPLEKIQGHCMIIPGNGNFMAQPCGNLVLTLKYSGSSTLYTRTSSAGAFEFKVPPDKKFKIGVDSKYYDIVSPQGNVEQGDDIDLQLKQK